MYIYDVIYQICIYMTPAVKVLIWNSTFVITNCKFDTFFDSCEIML